MTKSDGERIAALETLVGILREEQREANRKLDELLTFRNKGVGAFWLASALLGTGIVGSIVTFISWLKGG